MFAAINIYKPKGLTSHDVVAKLRRIFNLKKIGHLGTLDPMAEGVLPVCLGQATRLIEYFPSNKRYTAEVTLGRTTDTLDAEGEILSETGCSQELSPDFLENILSRFRGVIWQQVPLYSAVHVGGKKLYQIARSGEAASATSTAIELPSREVTIYSLQLLSVNLENPSFPVLTLDVACSSGTYIRSLARDIGEALDCGAYLSALLRTEHGHFQLKDSVTLDTLQTCENLHQYLLNPIPYLDLPILSVASREEARKLCQGMTIRLAPAETLEPNTPCLATYEEEALGVVRIVNRNQVRPVKIFTQIT
jgi:tRNA pseudouridine55 synthase